jgi:P27 family predicted phage terminase small subunit
MEMRGRKPQPTQLKVLRGNPGRRPLNRAEPAPAPALSLAPPAWLEGEAVTEWHRLAPVLHRLGLLTEIDGDALASYCQTWARWREAEAAIRKYGMVLKGKNGFPVISPYVAVANRAMAHMKALLIEFGMTPSSRTRVKTDTGAAPEADPFAPFDHAGFEPWKA